MKFKHKSKDNLVFKSFVLKILTLVHSQKTLLKWLINIKIWVIVFTLIKDCLEFNDCKLSSLENLEGFPNVVKLKLCKNNL